MPHPEERAAGARLEGCGTGSTRVCQQVPGTLRFLPFALLLLGGEALGVLAQFDRDLNRFIAAALLQGAVWSVAAIFVVRGGVRPSLALVLATAALMRLGALAAPVYLSDDIYRYIWDGRVQAAGINPYRYIPDDAELAA